MRKLIFGLGSGRCGTLSLSNLLNSQVNAEFTHERYPVQWGVDEKQITIYAIDIIYRNAMFVGDVGCSWLNQTPILIANMKYIKFVCLKRNKEDTIKSFKNRSYSKNFLVDPKSEHYDESIQKRFELRLNEGNIAFPRYDLSKADALDKYYDDYYERAENFQAIYPTNFKIFPIEDLNTEAGQRDILLFCGFENHIYTTENRWNEIDCFTFDLTRMDREFGSRPCGVCGKTAKNHIYCKNHSWYLYVCDECTNKATENCVEYMKTSFEETEKPCRVLDRRSQSQHSI